MNHIAIVIVNWNGKNDTVACLTSLRKLTRKNFLTDIIVVDNGSTDGSLSAVHKKFPDVILLPQQENLGFTGGNNRGIQQALDSGADIVWLLNNDTIVHPDSLAAAVPLFANKQVGIVGSKIYFSAGREFHKGRYDKKEQGKVLWYAGGLIDWNNMYASHRGVDEVDRGQYDKIEDTQFVTGCSMIIGRETFKKVGLLDEKYFLYLEDLDFCLRAKKAGFRLIYEPKSIVWHRNSGSTARPGNELHEYYFTRNRLLVGLRYAPVRTRLALLREAGRFLFSDSFIKRKAVKDAFAGRFGRQFIWDKKNQP